MGMIISIQQFIINYSLHKVQGILEAPLACIGNIWIFFTTYKHSLFFSGYKVLFVNKSISQNKIGTLSSLFKEGNLSSDRIFRTMLFNLLKLVKVMDMGF